MLDVLIDRCFLLFPSTDINIITVCCMKGLNYCHYFIHRLRLHPFLGITKTPSRNGRNHHTPLVALLQMTLWRLWYKSVFVCLFGRKSAQTLHRNVLQMAELSVVLKVVVQITPTLRLLPKHVFIILLLSNTFNLTSRVYQLQYHVKDLKKKNFNSEGKHLGVKLHNGVRSVLSLGLCVRSLITVITNFF